jgi:hypothetical protein
LGRVPNLAICRNYYEPSDILLLFGNEEWSSPSLGCIPFTSIDEAKLKAERGYPGISGCWKKVTYDDAAVAEFLRSEYDVDPNAEWWCFRCSFCQSEIEQESQAIVKGWATICSKCIKEFHASLFGSDA